MLQALERADTGTILVVDDYRPLAEAAATVAGMVTTREVAIAAPGDAMDRLEAENVSLVILNREMKPTGGPALAQAIRHRYPDTAIVMMGTQMDGQRARALGADDAISTPFNGSELRKLLDRLAPQTHVIAAE